MEPSSGLKSTLGFVQAQPPQFPQPTPRAPGHTHETPSSSTATSAASVVCAAGAAVAVAGTVARSRRAGKRSEKRRGVTAVPRLAVTTVDLPPATALSEEVDDSVKKLEQYVKDRGGSKVLRRILVANNGMAATKAILSLKQWSYLEFGTDSLFEFVAMATRDDLDANAEFIRLANTFVEVPSGKNVNNYANVDVICKTAAAQNVDAVWPGWGHASENPELPKKLKEMGITFIGPPSPVMSVLGDKIAANILAQTAGVPSIPWSGDGLSAELTEEGTIPEETFKKGTISSVEAAVECAERIGYPVMIKASEGGGGKGIRKCYSREEIEANFPQVVSEAPPGSPIFIMQLCKGARHIEVQIVGDQHGQAIALNGRDCSTQRRFQKIFEEGPPIVVKPETFKEMERAAQRLTQSIGYVGAGTVEYLYNAESDSFFFLELNPRLQVEHPVTEELTQVNLPATQLQVGMGIPLERIPQIRSFYGKPDTDTTSHIDFLQDEYVYPKRHVIAARITAENPDDGFKPTSGRIQRVKFQSSVSCWGYFCVGANGAIHEFADSQFGHIFAHGTTREDARKALMLALRNMDVIGEIRNPVEYLVELLGMSAFIDNTIDTSWLDGIIAEKTVALDYNRFDVVFYAAVFRAIQAINSREKQLLEALAKGQLGPLGQLSSANSFPVEIAFEGVKYLFKVKRGGPDRLSLTVGDQTIEAKVRTQPDGAIFVTVGNSVMKIFGTEEALGLRLRLEGIATIMVPTLYDPSELRSEFNGKIVRYLQDNGASVKEGKPYVELEAMKMIMPVKANASGKITHTRGAGSIVSAGELLGSLELEDPSKVRKIVPFTGDFGLTALETGRTESMDLMGEVELALDGFVPTEEPASLVQQLFTSAPQQKYVELASTIIERYLAVEEKFAELAKAGMGPDQRYLELISQNKDSLGAVAALALAHSQIAVRNEIVLSALRSVRATTDTGSLRSLIQRLCDLPPEGDYAQVALIARQYSEKINAVPFEDRKQDLFELLDGDEPPDFELLSQMRAVHAGIELLADLLGEESKSVRVHAMEALVRRIFRGFSNLSWKVSDEGPSRLSCNYTMQYPGVLPEDGTSLRAGYVKVVPSLKEVKDFLAAPIPIEDPAGQGNNLVQVIVAPDAFSTDEKLDKTSTNDEFEAVVQEMQGLLKGADAVLKAAGVVEFDLFLAQAPYVPHIACFQAQTGWQENPTRRDMRPTFPQLLEIEKLAEEYDLTRIVPVVGRNSQVYLGVQKGAVARGKLGKPSTVFVRIITHTLAKVTKEDDSWMEWPETLLLGAVDELERARLNPAVGTKPNSHIFANFMTLVDLDPVDADECFERFINQFVAKHGTRLQKDKVDEIVLKVGTGTKEEGRKNTLRFMASSMTGEYLKTYGLLEKVDPLTGMPAQWFEVQTGKESSPKAENKDLMLQKSQMARAAGSTYAPEFLGMIKVQLIKKWREYNDAGGEREVPANLFASVELVPGEDGELVESTRGSGKNTVGVFAWRCTLATPEYPEGRDLVLIANDVTFQAGSFGVAEDELFQKASEYARTRGLPRIHVACNSGARVGLVEELKPYVKAKWTDPADPSKGFDYMYLEEADYKRFEAGTVVAREEILDGKTVYALEAIIGEGLKSTSGGIGVENLKGSGLIAGETSRAYKEVFTLSYVTGRSVGIGAYLNRLGQRVIQMVKGPMILTGFGALNKLLGRKVYSSQDQLGGPQVMVPNGVTHKLVQSDQEGVGAIIEWLSYVPKDAWSSPPLLDVTDPVERDVGFTPSKTPYDPRHMLAGTVTAEGQRLSGFFDEGSFQEYLEGWGRSVVTGRAKLGGVPFGVIAVETRNVERKVPADPANPASQEVIEPQAGQVWFPDSAFKTATAIRDFNNAENLPLIIFANWRGFSGGTRDMYSEVLKFGAYIVDALVEYKHPVFVYIPPGGELRGGSWVVIDPSINPEQMEMYADVESRGGILEPAGIVEVKFRQQQQKEMMHRLDPELKMLDSMVENSSEFNPSSSQEVEAKIAAREEKLAPLYTQMACEFADLHDRAGRMEAKGVIRQSLEWRRSREFFYWRVRRRLLEQEFVRRVQAADPSMPLKDAQAVVSSWISVDGSDRDCVAALEACDADDKIEALRVAALQREVERLQAQLAAA